MTGDKVVPHQVVQFAELGFDGGAHLIGRLASGGSFPQEPDRRLQAGVFRQRRYESRGAAFGFGMLAQQRVGRFLQGIAKPFLDAPLHQRVQGEKARDQHHADGNEGRQKGA